MSAKKKRYVNTEREDRPVSVKTILIYNKVRRLGVSGAMGTTPTRALDKLRQRTEMTIESIP